MRRATRLQPNRPAGGAAYLADIVRRDMRPVKVSTALRWSSEVANVLDAATALPCAVRAIVVSATAVARARSRREAKAVGPHAVDIGRHPKGAMTIVTASGSDALDVGEPLSWGIMVPRV